MWHVISMPHQQIWEICPLLTQTITILVKPYCWIYYIYIWPACSHHTYPNQIHISNWVLSCMISECCLSFFLWYYHIWATAPLITPAMTSFRPSRLAEFITMNISCLHLLTIILLRASLLLYHHWYLRHHQCLHHRDFYPLYCHVDQ